MEPPSAAPNGYFLPWSSTEQIVYSKDVESVVVPAHKGYLGILAGHAPLLATLKPGEVTIRTGHEESHYFSAGGFIEATPKKVILLSESAEPLEKIDANRAEEARERARERLASLDKGVDRDRAQAALDRAEARLRIARKRKP